MNWSNDLKDEFLYSNEIIENEINIFNEKIDKLYKEYKDHKSEREYYTELNELDSKILKLKEILFFYKRLELSENEKLIIKNKMLILTGKAGIGKSHLLGTISKKLIDNSDYPILILGHTFINSNTVMNQIMDNYGLDYSFTEFFNVLEAIGSINNREVFIFLDAINESRFKEIWKNNLCNLYDEINKRKFIKLIVSIKNGYENYVLDEHIKNKISNKEITKIEHTGFGTNSFEIIHNFFDYYDIVFSPSDVLSYELTNPLFLTLYCKVYSEGEKNISELFKSIVEKTYLEIKDKLSLEVEKNILIELFMEIASILYEKGDMYISGEDLYNLNYWNKYQLRSIDIIPILLKNGILIDFSKKDEEYYSFSYNLLGDYFQAKYVIKKCNCIEDVIDSINYILLINNGEIDNYNNLDLFNFVCELSFSKFNIDPIDSIISQLKDDCKTLLVNKYIEGQSLRNTSDIDIESFKKIIKNNPLNIEIFFRMLIENSLKADNDLNSKYLDEVLFKLDLNKRDSMWTIFINELDFEYERIYQIVKYISEGKKFKSLSEEEIKLLLILLSWLLTSSNRYLRDITSKAIIEILKDSYELCAYILKRFEYVNDPYVIQRLYGCVFGACTKNFSDNNHEFKKLAEYVYEAIFNKDVVYPDILLRDYARLIIEKYLSFNNNDTIIKIDRISPPYKSEEIKNVPKKEYYDATKLRSNGLNRIDSSMRPDVEGLGYGDFGRYIFQANLNYFKDVDILNMYHYAMQYITENLGYSNDLFGDNDTNMRCYYRHDTRKIERIGKKYQWIVLYNILARVSDSYQLNDLYSNDKNNFGAWKLSIRDFDPTINIDIAMPKESIPKFNKMNSEVFLSEKEKGNKNIEDWINTKAYMFQESLIQSDNDSIEWVALYNFINAESNPEINTIEMDYNRYGAQRIWRIAQGYFIKEKKFDKLKKSLGKRSFLGRWFPEGCLSIGSLFNREYYWSSGYEDLYSCESLEYFEETGEKEVIKRKVEIPIYDGENIFIENKDWEEEIKLKEKVADIIPSFHYYAWEGQYDASQEDTTHFYIPCKQLVEFLKIQQRNFDGYFYNNEGELIAYDYTDNSKFTRFLIRKDHFEDFLEKNDYILFWTNMGEKRFNTENYKCEYSGWSGLTWYSKGKFNGEMSLQDNK